MPENIEQNFEKIGKNTIRFYFYIGSVSGIILLAAALSLIYTKSLNQEYSAKIDQLAESIINEKKRFLRNSVERTIYYIQQERAQVNEEYASKELTKEQIKAESINRISKYIREMRLIDNGYVWVNRIVNYEGGDNYALRQIHPNLPETEGSWLSTNTADIMGARPYEEELNGVKKNGELYFDYYFKKLNSEKIAHKMTFAKLYEPYDWVVATGVYLDDVDQLIEKETEKMQNTLKTQRFRSFSIAFFASLISIVVIVFFERQISRLISSYEGKIEQYTNSLVAQKEKAEKTLKEVKQLKGLLPICSHCKKIRDDKGYWNQIEKYILEHSDAEFSHGICQECLKKYYPDIDPDE